MRNTVLAHRFLRVKLRACQSDIILEIPAGASNSRETRR